MDFDDLCEKDKEIKELRTRMAEADEVIAQMAADNVKMLNQVDELQNRLSTLLKASEGMEKALEEITKVRNLRYNILVTTDEQMIAIKALADFRAVKENMEKGAGK